MGKIKNLLGQKFGRLTVIEARGINHNKNALWLCKCDCGNEKVIIGSKLIAGDIQSCGCLKIERIKQANTTHGLKDTRLYACWHHMKERCYVKKYHGYESYGGRGITVCDEWKNNFITFYKWAMANGYNDTLTIDRIDVNGNYEPSNCRWITAKEQQRNKRTNFNITYKNETKTLIEWSELMNIPYNVLRCRLVDMKWSVERALIEPVRKYVK